MGKWALENGGTVHFGRHGGSTFDRKVREALR
jgi:hypothetical protein